MQRPRSIRPSWSGSPEGSAIYFGVDFNVRSRLSRLCSRVLSCHRPDGRQPLCDRDLRERVGQPHPPPGKARGLQLDISASRSHEQTVDFYNSGQWHLFQNQVDRRWFGPPGKCANGLDVDTNLQNPKRIQHRRVGSGRSRQEAGTRKIFDQRRFAIRPTPVVQQSRRRRRWVDRPSKLQIRQPRRPKTPMLEFLVQSGAWSSVDIDEDGNADGQVKTL